MQYIDGKPTPTVTDTEILGFFGEYRFLSNFHRCNVLYEGILYPSSEHAYMAQKTCTESERAKFSSLVGLSAKDAKAEGRRCTLRSDWEQVKIGVMTGVLLAKFSQNPLLREGLRSTGTKRLEETNYWNDTFWGVCKGKGDNMLGKLLMEVRDQLRT